MTNKNVSPAAIVAAYSSLSLTSFTARVEVLGNQCEVSFDGQAPADPNTDGDPTTLTIRGLDPVDATKVLALLALGSQALELLTAEPPPPQPAAAPAAPPAADPHPTDEEPKEEPKRRRRRQDVAASQAAAVDAKAGELVIETPAGTFTGEGAAGAAAAAVGSNGAPAQPAPAPAAAPPAAPPAAPASAPKPTPAPAVDPRQTAISDPAIAQPAPVAPPAPRPSPRPAAPPAAPVGSAMAPAPAPVADLDDDVNSASQPWDESATSDDEDLDAPQQDAAGQGVALAAGIVIDKAALAACPKLYDAITLIREQGKVTSMKALVAACEAAKPFCPALERCADLADRVPRALAARGISLDEG